ncbi:ATP-dependent DNA helicase PIF1 [Ephemerocybe angulata]|uniref:ATP-dependent DNA helicase n=1 Tax=Ephemerocybe angulata TaxID=980116 RepID=A0A8H6LVY2_9AGAR|nr:ATP-dependent DNA helicase PIF1 [Tulosesus angulatus]
MATAHAVFAQLLRAHKLVDVRDVLRRTCGARTAQVKTWAAVMAFSATVPVGAHREVIDMLGGQFRDGFPSRPQGAQSEPALQEVPTPPPHERNPRPAPQVGMDVDEIPVGPEPMQVDRPDGPSCASLGVSPDYMKCVDEVTIDACIEEFTLRTGNAAMKEAICISCEGRSFAQELCAIEIQDIPNRGLLAPVVPHPAHTLTDGMLLATGSHELTDTVDICVECYSRLKGGRRPKHSLANGHWVGDIPPELQKLTLPERLLISLYFPVAYVVKLYPSGRRGLGWSHDRLNSGLRGNVSTYKLDQQQISNMIGLTMPPPATLLSSTIAISYIGANGLPKKALPGTFRVRRFRIARALQWLKANNPLYRDIEISDERLDQLPTNAVPQELLQTARHERDETLLDMESASYVPLHEGDEQADEDDVMEQLEQLDDLLDDDDAEGAEEDPEGEEVPPAVIPLQALGVIDMAGHDIPENELFAHALINTAMAGVEAERADAGATPSAPPTLRFARLPGQTSTPAQFNVRHGSAFVNEYPRKDPVTGLRYDGGPDNPNHLLGVFPFLFPYGKGGFETDQAEPVSYESHVRWALRYADRRFRKDLLFVFQTFGVLQKRQVCRAAILQVKSQSPYVHQQLKSITREDLIRASEEELRNQPFSNPAIRILRSQLTAIRSRVMGSDESRHSLRGKIWGTNLMYNNASLWITINPPDTHDPIAQVLVGEEIDLDSFCKTAGPDAQARAINVAEDPYAAAQYFHHVIEVILETLFGIKAGSGVHKIHRKEGILGTLQAYIGSVEAQGRGTLHLHLLLWMVDTPSPQRMKELLTEQSFRERLMAFVAQNIIADIEGRSTAEVRPLRVDKEAAYSRPLNPRAENIGALRKERTRVLARSLQFHTCRERACLIPKNGRKVCKRGSPWTLASQAWVAESGHWGPKRTCAMLNAFNPTLLTTLTCNHDMKLMIAGGATRSITWYITNYASKKQHHGNNQSALLAKSFAYHVEKEARNPDFVNANKRLLQRCANSLSRDREFSAPEIISYLMGWGDRFESHHYVAIRWDLAMKSLISAYPGLLEMSARARDLEEEPGVARGEQPENEAFTVQFVDGTLDFRNQVKEYAFRGEALAESCFLRVMLDTYDAPVPKTERRDQATEELETAPYQPGDDAPRARNRGGRARHDRIPYLEGYGTTTRCRIRRSRWHETLPRIVGRWFPRNNDPKTYELYCASMLMLLKPWRTLRDLKEDDGTFRQAFDAMMDSADDWTRRVVDNIQYYYDCSDDAQAEATEKKNSMSYGVPLEEDLRERYGIVFEGDVDPLAGLKEDDVEVAAQGAMSQRDQDYVQQGLLVAFGSGIMELPDGLHTVHEGVAGHAKDDDLDTIKAWDKRLKAYTREHGGLLEAEAAEDLTAAVLDAAEVNLSRFEVSAAVTPAIGPDASGGVLADLLNPAQRRAHDIIVDCVVNEVEGRPQEQLLMIVHGQGGTGKTTLIRAVTETLDNLGMKKYLGKTATSGIAASPIGGNTVHHYWGIAPMRKLGDPMWVSNASDVIKKRRLENLASKHIVFTDEMSMLTKAMLSDMSHVGSVVRAEAARTASNSTLPFGGLHMVLFGDFHQFPPVAGGAGGKPGRQKKENTSALYCHQPSLDKERMALGREIFLQFEKVVILNEQKRSRDPEWTELLDRLRVGECTAKDLDEVQKLVLTDPRCDVPDWNSKEWADVVLVTPRHKIRRAWNDLALAKHCRAGGHYRYVITAQDVDKFTGELPRLDYRVSAAAMPVKKTGDLERRITVGQGMKAMVLTNIATEADVANGTRGVIDSFWLHPDEQPTLLEDGVILLSHMPPVIFFRPNEKIAARFAGVPEGVVPISPATVSFEVENGLGQTITVKRTQYALTGAYAFTDYKSQGQTIEKVIIDIGKPPDNELSPFNAYVALSRGRGRDSIRLLRDFNPDLFTTHPSENLREEMSRLHALARQTEAEHEEMVRNREQANAGVIV